MTDAMPQPAVDKLNNKQRMFVESYLASWNATKAARAAGYANPHQLGYQLLHKTSVQDAIKDRLNEAAMRADEVLARLTQQARGDIAVAYTVVEQPDPVDATKKVRNIELDLAGLLTSGPSHLVKSITFTKAGPRIEMYDAQTALIQLGKAHGLFIDRVEGSGNLNLSVTADALGRLAPVAAERAAAFDRDVLGEVQS